MAISDADKARARKHLGYPAVRAGIGLAFGYPVISDPQFLFESQIQVVIAENEPHVVRLLDVLDAIECRMIEAATRGMPARSAEGVEINLHEGDDLEREYDRWGNRLADMLGCPYSPWAKRFKGERSVHNVRVG